MDTDRRVARYISFIRQTYTLPHLVIVCYPLANYYALESRLSLEHSVLFRQSWVQQALRNLLVNWLKWLWWLEAAVETLSTVENWAKVASVSGP